MSRAGIVALLLASACTRSPKTKPEVTSPRDAAPPLPAPSPPDIGPFTVTMTNQEFGAALGPLGKLTVTSGSGDVVSMSDPPPGLALGKASAADLDELRVALGGAAFATVKSTELLGEGGVATLAITTRAGTRSLSFGGGIPAAAQPVFAVLSRLERGTKAQPVPPLDQATIALTLQAQGAVPGPLQSVTITNTTAAAVESEGKVKKGSTEVFPGELTTLHMALMDPALAAVESTNPGGESLHRSLTITMAGQTRSWHFDRDIPAEAQPLVTTLIGIMKRALGNP